jgi:hypothetical protein
VRYFLAVVLGALLVTSSLSLDLTSVAAAPTDHGKHHHGKKHKKRTRTVRSSGGRVELRIGAATVKAPRGAIRKGESITLSVQPARGYPPLGAASIAGASLSISSSQGEPAKPVSVTLPYNQSGLLEGGEPLILHGIDGNWMPEETVVNRRTNTVSTKLTSFSPLDVVESITWAVGSLTGNRSALPTGCGSPPSWIEGVAMSGSRNESLPSCIAAESDSETLYVRIVNNRGYAQFLTTSGAVIDVSRSGWGDSVLGTIAAGLERLSTGNTRSSFLLAPGSQATVAFDRPPRQIGDTTVTLRSASQGATAAATLAWALLGKLKKEFGKKVNATDCVIGVLHSALGSGVDAGSAIGRLHTCATAATAGLKGSAKTLAAKIAIAVLATDFFYKVIDLAADELYPPRIEFTIQGLSPIDPGIRVEGGGLGSLRAGQRAVFHLSASGGSPPYRFAQWIDSSGSSLPAWADLASDGTLTLDPPLGVEGDFAAFVYAYDSSGRHSPFARDRVTFSVQAGQVGMSWRAIEVPVPPGAQQDSGVLGPYPHPVCAQQLCVIPGYYRLPGGQQRAMLVSLREGVWSAQDVPVPLGGDPGSGVIYGGALAACSRDGTCVLTGDFRVGNDTREMLVTLANGAWSASEVPVLPGGSQASVYASLPACTADGNCMLWGRFWDAALGQEREMVLTRTDATWRASPPPVPAGGEAGSGDLYNESAAACTAEGKCLLMGIYLNETDEWNGMIVELSAGVVSALQVPMPGSGDTERAAFGPVCGAITCVLPGFFRDQETGTDADMLVTLSNDVWSAVRFPVPPGGEGHSGFEAGMPACSAGGVCVVAGGYREGSESKNSFLALRNGAWQATMAPAPSGVSEGTAYAPACSADGLCVQGGSFKDSAGVSRGMVAVLSGQDWSAIELPVPADGVAGTAATIQDPACSDASTCVLAAEYLVNSLDRRDEMIATVVGSSWEATKIPVPLAGLTGTGTIRYEGLACTGVGVCIVPGKYQRFSGGAGVPMIAIGERR